MSRFADLGKMGDQDHQFVFFQEVPEIRKNGKLVGYEACNVCYKCQELEQAKKTAADGVFRYQEGIKYFSTISKDMK
jgi:hypothetical protein